MIFNISYNSFKISFLSNDLSLEGKCTFTNKKLSVEAIRYLSFLIIISNLIFDKKLRPLRYPSYLALSISLIEVSLHSG